MKILMIGPNRDVQGGISSVVNNYYDAGLGDNLNLKYIGTMKDGSKINKLIIAIKSYIEFKNIIAKYDLVHIHMSSRASFYRKAIFIKLAKKYNKKIIIHMHGSEFAKFYNDECNIQKQKYIKQIFGYADKVIALSEEWEIFLSKICSREKIEVVYNSVILPQKMEKNYSQKSILFLGRLGKRKGTYDLLEVIPKVLKKHPSAKFYLGGDGDLEKVSKICQEKGIEKNVYILGWIKGNDKIELLNSCNIYILPSYNEGMPMSLLEAMSYGNAVISTYVGGIPKVIKNNFNGLLFEAGSTEEMYECIDSILSDECHRKMLGNNAYNTIKEKFDINKNIETLIKIYKELVYY